MKKHLPWGTPTNPVPWGTPTRMPAMSWVIRNKETGEAVFETFDRRKVDALNISKYEALPIGDYLGAINGRCPHGFVLAENVCGPCSEGRPNTPQVNPEGNAK